MFDIGWTELAIIALIALLVIGPKDLPQAMRTIAGWVRRIRAMARDFQSGIDDMVHEAELDGIKDEFGAVAGTDLDAMVENTIDPDGTLASEYDIGSDFAPPDETNSAPQKKKKSSKPKAGTKRAAGTGTKTKRAKVGPGAKKAARKRAPAKRAAINKAPAGNKAQS